MLSVKRTLKNWEIAVLKFRRSSWKNPKITGNSLKSSNLLNKSSNLRSSTILRVIHDTLTIRISYSTQARPILLIARSQTQINLQAKVQMTRALISSGLPSKKTLVNAVLRSLTSHSFLNVPTAIVFSAWTKSCHKQLNMKLLSSHRFRLLNWSGLLWNNSTNCSESTEKELLLAVLRVPTHLERKLMFFQNRIWRQKRTRMETQRWMILML